jgi:hypothetical protein
VMILLVLQMIAIQVAVLHLQIHHLLPIAQKQTISISPSQ